MMGVKPARIGRRFQGKVAIAIASTQGIGFSIAEHLSFRLEGASGDVSSRKQNNGNEKLKGKGLEVLGVVCHVSKHQQRKNLVDLTVQKYGKIHVIISNPL
ncbi:hypothetical protein MLD38_019431 [Melastoma candidum]|uniref:Uncharacterized protein n=1 Tax=Melastoma candidum TaxID=119954 RepID=A0ACB9QXK2_9MYRT|nr:hypothetical protein MLD38_019431 [Melastoma candidum]